MCSSDLARAIGTPRVLDAAQQREFFETVAQRGYGTRAASPAEEG